MNENENESDTIKEEAQSNFNFNIYYSEAQLMTKKLFNNSNKILAIFIFLIVVLLYFFISSLSFESKNKEIKLTIKNNLFVSYDDFGKKFYEENKTLSFDYLDEYFYKIKRNYSNFDNIHLLFAFNSEYHLLASVTITSILKTANKNTYIHIHIIASKGFEYEIMKKLNSLKEKINKNVEFIFYDGSKAEDDFGSQIKDELFGVGEYAKLLGPVLVDKKIYRILALDAGDLLVQKDLLELYNYPLDDYLIRGSFDPYAPCYPDWNIFFLKEGYLNAGVYLYNLKKWREMDIYNDILKFFKYLEYKDKLKTPHQDIINWFLPSASVGIFPARYNLQEYIDVKNKSDEQKGSSLYNMNCSYYYNKKEEIIKEAKNIIIWHYTKSKIHKGEGAPFLTKQWKKYAKMTGFYEEITQKYPEAFWER